MDLQKGPDFWQPLLVKILGKADQQPLSEKKTRKKLVKKASKVLGLDPGNKEIGRSADAFLLQARNSKSLNFSSKFISLLHSSDQQQQPEVQPQRQPSRPAPKLAAVDQPSLSNRGGPAGPSSSQTAAEEPRQKKRKHAQAARGTAEMQQNAGKVEAPAKKQKKKERLKEPANTAGEPLQPPARNDAGNATKDQRTEQPIAAASGEQVVAVAGKKKKRKKNVEAAVGQPPEESPGQQNGAVAAADQGATRRQKEGASVNFAIAQEGAQSAAGKAGVGAAGRGPAEKGAAAFGGGLEGAEGAKTWREDYKRTDVKHGRFSAAERETIKQAVKEYAETNGLSQTDLGWLYTTKKKSTARERKVTKSAWMAIAAALPHRKAKSVWACGTRMLHSGNFKGKWTAEEENTLRELHAVRGDRWKELGESLGRLPEAVRDKCKSLKLGDARKKGTWSTEEEGKLLKLVTDHLERRPASRPVDGRIVLDDLPWDVISQLHGSRDEDQCRWKWTQQLSPSMVDRGDWGLGDDRRLLKSLFRSGAANDWELDWDALVPGRAAAVTRRRWRLMLKCVPDAAEKGFNESVDFLVEKYTPNVKKKAQQGNAPGEGAVAQAEAA